jgi:hypothetical protein
LTLEYSRSEYEKVRRGLSRLREEIAGDLGLDDIPLRDLILYVCERLVENGAEEIERRSEGGTAQYALVYHTCPECRRAKLQTEDGFVEVDREEIERVEGEAVVETITSDEDALDRPTPPAMRRKVVLREGERCANPHCQHPAEQCHHIIHRSKGGNTVFENIVATCRRCHAMIHAGLLRVSGRPGEDLLWSTRCEQLERQVRRTKRRASRLPVLRLESAHADCTLAASSAGSARADSPGCDLSAIAAGLVKLGFTSQESRARVERAMDLIGESERSEENLLKAALSL